MVENLTQFLPPCCSLVTAVGNQHQVYAWINTLDPFTYFQKFSTVDRITVVTAECDFAYLFYNIGTNLLLKKIQA
jgi:hypothetical protein